MVKSPLSLSSPLPKFVAEIPFLGGSDPHILPLPSPHNANLWKLLVHEGSRIDSADQPIAILEAMKLEIKVPAGEEAVGGVVEKVLVREGEVVGTGARLVLVRKGG